MRAAPVRLLLLFADTGGGHRAAALAVVQALHQRHPNRFAPVLCAQIPGVIRVVRGEVFAQPELEYVQAEVVSGTPTRTILFRHILPNVLNPVVVQTSLAVPATIIGAAILSFLGLGVQPPTADWGTMLADAENYLG